MGVKRGLWGKLRKWFRLQDDNLKKACGPLMKEQEPTTEGATSNKDVSRAGQIDRFVCLTTIDRMREQ